MQESYQMYLTGSVKSILVVNKQNYIPLHFKQDYVFLHFCKFSSRFVCIFHIYFHFYTK